MFFGRFETRTSNVFFFSLQLQKCVGSAIVAMGPEKILALLPLSLNTKDLSFSNAWLIPILKEYVIGSSLGFFMEHIVPLAQSLRKLHEGVRSIYCIIVISNLSVNCAI